MPTYEYKCDGCGEQFEREQSMSDPPVTECPRCKEAKVKRLISSGAFVLRGTGWFKTGGY